MPDKWLKDAWEFLFAVVLGLELAARHRLKLMREKLASGWSVVMEVAGVFRELATDAWKRFLGIAADYVDDVLWKHMPSHLSVYVLAAMAVGLSMRHEEYDVKMVLLVAAFAAMTLLSLAYDSVASHRHYASWIDCISKIRDQEYNSYRESLDELTAKTSEAAARAIELTEAIEVDSVIPECSRLRNNQPKWQAKSALLDACRAAMEAEAFASEEELVEFVRWSREEVAVAEMECDE